MVALVAVAMIGLVACTSDNPASETRATETRATASAGATPLAPAGARPSVSAPPPPVTLAFAGDIHFAGSSGERLAADPNTAIGEMASVLSEADVAVANLETAVTTAGVPAPGKEFTFRAPPTAFTALRAAGLDVVSMANNHGMDYGAEGLQDSLRYAQQAGFPVIGIGQDENAAYTPFLTTVKGQRIGVVAATQVIDDELVSAWTAGPGKPGLASAKRTDRLLEAVRATRAQVDTLVVFLHWGVERMTCPSQDQTSLAAALAEAGADVVVGSHAHVLLGGGWAPGGTYVDYGLGNFVFYASGIGPNTDTGVLELTVVGRSVAAATWTPGRIVGGAPQILTGDEASAAQASWEGLRGCTGLGGPPADTPAVGGSPLSTIGGTPATPQ